MGSRNKVLVLEPAIRCGALNPVALNQCPGDLSQTVREDSINVRHTHVNCGMCAPLGCGVQIHSAPVRANSHDQALFFAAFNFAHLAFCAAATAFLAAADSVRLLFIGTILRVFRAFAHRAL